MSSPDKPTSRRPVLRLTAEDYEFLRSVSLRSGSESRLARRAKFLLAFAHGMKITDAARLAGFSRPVAYRWLERAAELGIRVGIADKPYDKEDRSDESLRWVTEVAMSSPQTWGEEGDTWTCEQLARFVRARASKLGHPDLARITTGGLRRILNAEGIDPEDHLSA